MQFAIEPAQAHRPHRVLVGRPAAAADLGVSDARHGVDLADQPAALCPLPHSLSPLTWARAPGMICMLSAASASDNRAMAIEGRSRNRRLSGDRLRAFASMRSRRSLSFGICPRCGVSADVKCASCMS